MKYSFARIEREQHELEVFDFFMTRSSLEFQTDMRKAEAELIKATMTIQSSLIEKFINFMQQTIYINTAFIEQQTKLYELADINEDKADYFLNKANSIKILSTQQFIDFTFQQIKQLNLGNAAEMKYLEFKLKKTL